MVTASTPIAAVYNGQLQLGSFIAQLQSNAGANGVAFGSINEVYQFNLYKVIKPKIIYARYTSRVLPDANQSFQLNTNGYYPTIVFKIDYDACCVGQMALLLTTDISVKDSQDDVILNGYMANGTGQIAIKRKDIQSIQIAYGTDFLYNFIDTISIGFCNTGGGNTTWHQEVPAEIAKIYHAIIESTGVSQTIKRWTREDVFTIQHNPYHQYGNFSFALKPDNAMAATTQVTSTTPITYTRNPINSQYQAGFNEIAMYWVDAKIKEIDFTRDSYSQYSANSQNWQVGLRGYDQLGYQSQLDSSYYPTMSNIKVIDGQVGSQKYLQHFDLTYISKIYYGTTDTTYTLQLPSIMGAGITESTTAQNVSVNQIVYTGSLTQYNQSTFGVSGTTTSGEQTLLQFSDATDLYNVINSLTITDKTGQQLTNSNTNTNVAMYKLTQSLVAPIPLYITTSTAWNNATERQKVLLKLVQLVQQGVYPQFNINLDLYKGADAQTNIYYIPFIIMNIESTLYELVVAIYQGGTNSSVQFFGQIGINATVNNNDTEYVDQIQFRNIRLAGEVSTTVEGQITTTYYIQNIEQDATAVQNLETVSMILNANKITLDTGVQLASFGFNQGISAGKLYLFEKYYDGNVADNNYITIPGFVNSTVSDNNLTNSLLALTYIDTVGLSIQANGYYPWVSYSLMPISKVYQEYNYSNIGDFVPDFYWNAPPYYRFLTQFQQLSDFVQAMESEVQTIAFKQTGAVSPYLNTGSINTVNIEIEKYDDNDFALTGLAWYYTINVNNQATYDRRPNPGTSQQKYDTFRFNAAMLNNHDNEEFNPSLINQDYISIHTYKNKQGLVDFYLPLSFLFTCNGIRNSFPHYACSAQSMVIKFTFQNPLTLMNVSMAVNPSAIDPLDFSKDARIFINRANNLLILQNNVNNNGAVLFYNRYQWIPEVLDVITEYQFYAWVTKNYERQYKFIQTDQSGSYYELWKYTRSVFYTKIWCFVVAKEVLNVLSAQGGFSGILPIEVNKYSLPIWDVLNYDFQSQQLANGYNGNEQATFNSLYNSVYSLIPFESVKIETDSNIQMSDDLPFRFKMFDDYMLLDHTQVHSALPFNNLLQFNLDPVYYQEDAPNAIYSPAYAPQFKIMYKPKNTLHSVQQYGVIMISECVNISYIKDHLILYKYWNIRCVNCTNCIGCDSLKNDSNKIFNKEATQEQIDILKQLIEKRDIKLDIDKDVLELDNYKICQHYKCVMLSFYNRKTTYHEFYTYDVFTNKLAETDYYCTDDYVVLTKEEGLKIAQQYNMEKAYLSCFDGQEPIIQQHHNYTEVINKGATLFMQKYDSTEIYEKLEGVQKAIEYIYFHFENDKWYQQNKQLNEDIRKLQKDIAQAIVYIQDNKLYDDFFYINMFQQGISCEQPIHNIKNYFYKQPTLKYNNFIDDQSILNAYKKLIKQ